MFDAYTSIWSGSVFLIAATTTAIRRAEGDGSIPLQRILQRGVVSELDFHVLSQCMRTYYSMSLLAPKGTSTRSLSPNNQTSTDKSVTTQQPKYATVGPTESAAKINGFSFTSFAQGACTEQALPIDIRLLTTTHEDVCDGLETSYALVSQQELSNMSSKILNSIISSALTCAIRF
jgi:hypothetical protein